MGGLVQSVTEILDSNIGMNMFLFLFRCFECFEGRSSEIFLDGLGNQKHYFRIHNQQLIIQ